mmetsp:Transcript_32349/g.29168  ORF Transcript_32349/g.29168 Transcript_32349/m.29168 type:complete len:95 (-) Transcript_32349:375-659(-)
MDAFKNGFMSQARYFRRMDSASSPFHQHITNIDERRSRLFPDRRRVPGRLAKCALTVALVINLWSIKKFSEIRSFKRMRGEDTKKMYRKSAPFL